MPEVGPDATEKAARASDEKLEVGREARPAPRGCNHTPGTGVTERSQQLLEALGLLEPHTPHQTTI